MFEAVKSLGSNVLMINIRMRSSVQPRYCYIIKTQEIKCRRGKKRSRNDKVY